MAISIARNDDCMNVMREYPDGYFDLAVVDPPYGDGGGAQTDSAGGATVTRAITRTGGRWAKKFGKKS